MRAKAMLSLMSKGLKIERIDSVKIPEIFEKFFDERGTWAEVKFPKESNTSACVYRGEKGGMFRPHKHGKHIEQIVILNQSGSMKLITSEEIKKLTYPCSVVVDKNVPHAAIFESYTEILVMWTPKMTTGWTAKFTGEAYNKK